MTFLPDNEKKICAKSVDYVNRFKMFSHFKIALKFSGVNKNRQKQCNGFRKCGHRSLRRGVWSGVKGGRGVQGKGWEWFSIEELQVQAEQPMTLNPYVKSRCFNRLNTNPPPPPSVQRPTQTPSE